MPWKALIAEAIATFALCFVGAGAIMTNEHLGEKGFGLVGIALAHGLILAVVVTATMNVSGGHVNPAVTFAMLLTRRISLVNAMAYVLAQLVGGILAGLLLYQVVFKDIYVAHTTESVVLRTSNGTPNYDVAKLAPPEQIGSPTAAEQNTGKAAIRAVTIEAILTFLLVFAVFGSAVDPRHPNVGGFAIGLTVAADILIGGPLTGAAMNPARVVGTAFPMLFAGGSLLAQQWVYWVGPLLGGALAGLVYQHAILESKSPAAPAD